MLAACGKTHRESHTSYPRCIANFKLELLKKYSNLLKTTHYFIQDKMRKCQYHTGQLLGQNVAQYIVMNPRSCIVNSSLMQLTGYCEQSTYWYQLVEHCEMNQYHIVIRKWVVSHWSMNQQKWSFEIPRPFEKCEHKG